MKARQSYWHLFVLSLSLITMIGCGIFAPGKSAPQAVMPVVAGTFDLQWL